MHISAQLFLWTEALTAVLPSGATQNRLYEALMHATAPCKSPDRWLQSLLFWRSISFVELVSPLGLVDEMRSIYSKPQRVAAERKRALSGFSERSEPLVVGGRNDL